MNTVPRLTSDEIRKIGQLLVTCFAGTTVVIVVQTIGEDWGNWSIWPFIQTTEINWGFTADRLVRYLFAIWFGSYLFLAYLANEARPDSSWKGIAFDIAQSIFIFAALGSLGFVTQDFSVFRGRLHLPLITAFASIGFVAGFTFYRHLNTKDAASGPSLQLVRFLVLVTALAAIAYVALFGPRTTASGAEWLVTTAFVMLPYLGLYLYASLSFSGASRKG